MEALESQLPAEKELFLMTVLTSLGVKLTIFQNCTKTVLIKIQKYDWSSKSKVEIFRSPLPPNNPQTFEQLKLYWDFKCLQDLALHLGL